jgi:hypothetical protein
MLQNPTIVNIQRECNTYRSDAEAPKSHSWMSQTHIFVGVFEYKFTILWVTVFINIYTSLGVQLYSHLYNPQEDICKLSVELAIEESGFNIMLLWDETIDSDDSQGKVYGIETYSHSIWPILILSQILRHSLYS